MKDFAGNELEEGMMVICLTAGATSSWMIWGEIVGFTPKKVKVHIKRDSGFSEITVRDPDRVVVPANREMLNYMRNGYGHPADWSVITS